METKLFTLTKLSSTGFEFTGTQEEVQSRLYGCICFQCKCEYGLNEKSHIDDMLYTLCGAEFSIEEATE